MLNLMMFCSLILEWPVIFPDNMFKLAGLIKLNVSTRNQTFFNNKQTLLLLHKESQNKQSKILFLSSSHHMKVLV